MDFDEIKELKSILLKLFDKLGDIEKEMASVATMNSVKREIMKLSLQHKDAITIKEASERLNIPIQTLYRYRDRGMLKVTEDEGRKSIIFIDDYINFTIALK